MIDLLREADRQKTAKRIAAKSALRPFGHGEAPPFRILAVKLGEQEHLVCVTFFHLFSNGTSIVTFFEQLLTLYHDSSVELPATKQLSEFVAECDRRDTTENEEFWSNQLEDPPGPLDLPTDCSRPATFSFHGDRVVEVVADPLFHAVKEAAKRSQATLFEFLFAAMATLLHRLSGQNDILIGVPFESEIRRQPGGPQLIAYSSNVLPLRSRVDGNPSFSGHLSSISDLVRRCSAHREYFSPRLISKLQRVYDPSRIPLLSVFLTLFNLEPPGLNESKNDLKASLVTDGYPYSAPVGTTANDLVFQLAYRKDRLEIHCDFPNDIFRRETVQRWMKHFVRLLESAVGAPQIGVLEIPLLSSGEVRTIVEDRNRTARPFPERLSIDEIFAKNAEMTPDAIAVVHNELSITYGELNRRANRLASHLLKLGLQPGSFVGISLDRSIGLVVAKLATLKAGAGYIPINTSYPPDRKCQMVGPAAVVITTNRWLADFAKMRLPTIIIDRSSDLEIDDHALSPISNGESVAAVLYTSGSTGRPKGAKIPHRAVTGLVLNTNYMTLDAGDAIAHRTNIGFDVALFEIWGALLNGCRLVIIDQEVQLSPSDFVRELRRQKVTRLWMTTSLFHLLAREVPDAFRNLRQVFVGGEPLDAEAVARVLRHGAPKDLLNVYGPTETTAFSTTYSVKENSSPGKIVPLGKPIANTQVYILDRFFAPVPIGIVGEIFIGGAGIAHGYIDAPALTAERFLKNPFSSDPNALFYKTGDLAKWLPDGNIQFVGRADSQIKIRGFRVELGEIESLLKTHPSVKECAVIVRGERSDNDRRIVAYVTGEQQQAATLREYLSGRLPDWMLPSAIVHLERLPFNVNGKIDRDALPEPLFEELGKRIVAPKDRLESQLLTLWREILNIPTISVTDNFFDLGGHSLLALPIFLRIEKLLGKRLPLSILFEAPTIQKLAETIRRKTLETERPLLVPINPEGSGPPFFGIHGSFGEVLFYRSLSRALGRTQPFYGIQSPVLGSGSLPYTTIETLASYYMEEIRKVWACGPYLIGGYSFGGVVAFEIACQLRALGEDVALVALFDSPNPTKLRCRQKFASRVKKRFAEIATMPLGYKLPYLAGRAMKRIQIELQKARRNMASSDQPNKRTEAGSEIFRQLRISMIHEGMLTDYRPNPFPGHVTLFKSKYPPDGFEYLKDLGWSGYAEEGVAVVPVPGTHSSLFQAPHVGFLAERLREVLEGALRTLSRPADLMIDSPSMGPEGLLRSQANIRVS